MQNKNKNEKQTYHLLQMVKGKDIPIHLAIIALMIYGLLMIGSASLGRSVNNSSYLIITMGKQFAFLLIGYLMMAILSRKFSLKWLKSQSFPGFMIIMEVLLLMCLIFREAGGAKAWIRIPLGPAEVTIQSSEFVKVASILILAAYVGDVRKRYDKPCRQILGRPLLFIATYVFTIIFLQSDFGSAAIVFGITCVCLLIPRNKQLSKFQKYERILFWAVLLLAVFALSPLGEAVILALPLKPYQKLRFTSAINPFEDRYGNSYQLVNGLISFATGGLFGVGYGNSVRKYTDFPAANTDFILSILVEELGFVGFLLLMFFYCVIMFRLFHFARKMKSEKGRIILVGTAMYFMIHIFLNVGGVTGLIPLTGIPLPLLSAGGSSAWAVLSCVGISQAVIASYKRGEIE